LFDAQCIGVKLFRLISCNRFEPDCAGVDQTCLADLIGDQPYGQTGNQGCACDQCCKLCFYRQ